LLSVVVCDSLRVHDEAECVEVELSFAAARDLGIAAFAPVAAPCVFNDPAFAFLAALPAYNFENMAALEAESVTCARVDTICVSEHICVWVELTKDWPICQNFLLDVLCFRSDAEVDNSVEIIGLTALVLFEMIIWALSLSS
jgi:hypothetical protein